MSKKPRKPQSPDSAKKRPALPSHAEILAYLAEHGEAGKRDIARYFGVKGGARNALKAIVKAIRSDDPDAQAKGLISSRGKGKGKNNLHHLPHVLVADILDRNRDGELIALPVEWPDEEAPRILVDTARAGRAGQPVPGIGDRVLLRILGQDDEMAEPLGRAIKILARKPRRSLGMFRATPQGGRFVPVDKKAQGRELDLTPEAAKGLQDGDLIAVSLTSENRFKAPRVTVEERLGSLKSEKAISLIAIHTHDIPHVFNAAALREAEQAHEATLAGREDWRSLPLVTIDPPDAKDHDDAVHAMPDEDPANPGGFIVTVAIADVAAYVRPGSALDTEALERGNSVYFPDRVVPMLPERISNDLCSLKADLDRPAMAVRMVLDAQGVKRRHSFHRIMMRSRAKLAYTQAQAAIDGKPDALTQPLLDPVLHPLWQAYRAAAKARDARQPLALDLPERKIMLRGDGTVDRVLTPERLDAHRLIEEFMILANVAAAETLEKAGQPLIYRVHDEPSIEKMRSLADVLASVGIKMTLSGALRPAYFNAILARVAETQHRDFINEIVLRSQAQAEYAAENYGHFGLNLRRYAHFTSPIRRYADLIVHRALIAALQLGEDGLSKDTGVSMLNEIGARISAAERRAMAAERETIDRLIATHLADRIGATFSGRITGVVKSGLFARLDETGADGFIPAATLGKEYFQFDERAHAMVGVRSGETFRLGDPVDVRLAEATPVAGALRFELISSGKPGDPPRGKNPRSKRIGGSSRDQRAARDGHRKMQGLKRGTRGKSR